MFRLKQLKSLQLGMAANIQKRDTAAAGLGDVEITTQSIFDKIQAGIKNTFSEDNLNVSGTFQ